MASIVALGDLVGDAQTLSRASPFQTTRHGRSGADHNTCLRVNDVGHQPTLWEMEFAGFGAFEVADLAWPRYSYHLLRTVISASHLTPLLLPQRTNCDYVSRPCQGGRLVFCGQCRHFSSLVASPTNRLSSYLRCCFAAKAYCCQEEFPVVY